MQPKYLAKLVCPLTKKPLEYHADKQELWSKTARLAFPMAFPSCWKTKPAS